MAHILVVDDDADIRAALSMALELDGYEVRTARHGLDAWEQLAAGAPPALILLDLAMPVLDGPGLLARMRAVPRLRELPVVVVTAFGSLAGAVDGVQGFLHKPVDLDVVLSLAARHCPRAAAAAASP
jgi:CheY-like chemotaxis protein